MIDPLHPTAPDDETQLSEGEAQAAISHIEAVAGLLLTSAQLSDLLADWTHVRENIIDWGMDDPAAMEDLNNTLASELLDEPWQEGDEDFLAQLRAAATKRGYATR
ncbi:hypothetical protein [Silvimonas amylolytica]|uniref:Uncharacterized protein n=1 Tax=Silvimonas amylolytica TaxID=449663 RepID=A0ABQ2PKZ7_9NEIS|nr:hypothetical protein [Silvimonas amylolytica]GGP26299.1 hypothetical protein GCM10010971_21180 [Silvimonas amylolytica]